jgi:hypothetical protein
LGERRLTGKVRGELGRLELADCRSSSASTERSVWVFEPPFSVAERLTVGDPDRPFDLPGSGCSTENWQLLDRLYACINA